MPVMWSNLLSTQSSPLLCWMQVPHHSRHDLHYSGVKCLCLHACVCAAHSRGFSFWRPLPSVVCAKHMDTYKHQCPSSCFALLGLVLAPLCPVPIQITPPSGPVRPRGSKCVLSSRFSSAFQVGLTLSQSAACSGAGSPQRGGKAPRWQ